MQVAHRHGERFALIDTSGTLSLITSAVQVSKFSAGLLAFQDEKGWGFLDNSGKTVVAPQYEEVEDFRHGLARCSRRDREEYLNKDGKIAFSMPRRHHGMVESPRSCAEAMKSIHEAKEAWFLFNHDLAFVRTNGVPDLADLLEGRS